MYRYVIKRILMMIPVMLGVTFVIFSMMYISESSMPECLSCYGLYHSW